MTSRARVGVAGGSAWQFSSSHGGRRARARLGWGAARAATSERRPGRTPGPRTAVSPEVLSRSGVDPVGHGVVGVLLEVEVRRAIAAAGLGVFDRDASQAVVL